MSDRNKLILDAYESKNFDLLREILGFDIISLYNDRQNGYNNRELLKKYSISINTMLKNLKLLKLYDDKHGKNQHKSCNITKQWLEEQLLSKTVKEIAEDIGSHPSTISKHIKKHKLLDNAQSWAASKSQSNKNNNLPKLTKEYLEVAYQTKTAKQIASETNTSDTTVLSRLKKYGIIPRKNGEHQIKCDIASLELLKNKEWLMSKYENNTAQEIADSINCTQRLVLIYLKRHGIQAKNPLYYESVRKPSKPQKDLAKLLSEKYEILEGYVLSDGKRNYEIDIYIPGIKMFIEVQGLHWHGLEANHWKYHRVRSKMWFDMFKFLYISKNYTDHTIKYVHESNIDSFFLLKCDDTRPKFVKENYSFNISDHNVRKFIESNHYLQSCSGHLLYSLSTDDNIVAAAAFGSVIRQNIPNTNNHTLELKRLVCTDRSKNVLSYFLSRCIKDLKNNGYTKIISYADISPVRKGEHSGSIYKATNFKYIGMTQPSYFYWKPEQGCVHKKTLYNRAKKNGLTEKEYYTSNGYFKLPEWPKHKFEYTMG